MAPDDVDAHRFFTLVDRGRTELRAGAPEAASSSFAEALDLWRGNALADVTGSVRLEGEAARLDEARLAATEDRIDADLECGRHHSLIAELDSLVASNALRERLWGQRILALYRDGRQAEALRACTDLRRKLATELGVDPGPAVRALEKAVIAQDPDLDWKPRRSTDPQPEMPPVHYAKTRDGINLAYQVVGEGPFDLILIPGFTSHLETWWAAWSGRLVRRLSSFSRLILFDKRGMGLSDRPSHVDVEHWVADVRDVLDAAGSERAAVLGMSAGTPVAILFAATYPERTRALVLYGGYARAAFHETDYPIGADIDEMNSFIDGMEARWGTGSALRQFCPSIADDPEALASFAHHERLSASPGSATTYLRATSHIDVRYALPTVSAPTLVLNAAREEVTPIAWSRYMAERLPDAKLVELDSADHLLWYSDVLDTITEEIESFLTGAVPRDDVNRVLTTVLIVDLGTPTNPGAEHCADVIDRFRGTVVARGPAGIVATFDGPARAVRCASEIVEELCALRRYGRAGLHSGECDIAGTDVRGVAVDIARQVASLAKPGEVLVSQTVHDVVLGSGLTFRPPRCHTLDGIEGEWRVHAVTAAE